MKICYFTGDNTDLYITEIGHSRVECAKSVAPRVREDYLLHIVINGDCHFSEFDVSSGNVLLISKGIKHHFSVEEGYEHFWIGFGGKKAKKLLEEYGVDAVHHNLLPIRSFTFIHKLIALSLKSCIAEKNEEIAIATLKACLQLCEVNKKYVSKSTDIDRAIRFIENNYHKSLKIGEVANYIGISEKHFCRKFVRYLGISPQKYLINVRMEKARELLRTTDFQIKEVACSVGYSSQLTFSAMYKKHYGRSPSFERAVDK